MLSPRSNRTRLWQTTSRSKNLQLPFARQGEYPRISCAFHPEEKITNFCKNYECLLPLCPRCVKIHTQEHMKCGTLIDYAGTHGDFEIVSDCFKYLEEELTEVMKSAKQLSQQAHQIVNDRKTKLNDVKATYQQAKKSLLEQLQRILQQYQLQLQQRLQSQQISFSQQLLAIEDSICFLLANSKKGIESLYSAYALQHLIQYYSQEMFSFDENIAKCKNQLQGLDKSVFDFKLDATQISNLRGCIRRFFDGNEEHKVVGVTFNKFRGSGVGVGGTGGVLGVEVFDTKSQNIGVVRSNKKMEDPFKEPSIRMMVTSAAKNHTQPLTFSARKQTSKSGLLAGRLGNSAASKYFETPLEGFDLAKSGSRSRARDIQDTESYPH